MQKFSLSSETKLLVVFGLITIILFITLNWWVSKDRVKFNSDQWKQASSTQESVAGQKSLRRRMVHDLIKTHLNDQSLTKVKITQLLGQSDETDKFAYEKYDFIYVLGPTFIDHEWLLIWFNDNGKLEKFSIVSD